MISTDNIHVALNKKLNLKLGLLGYEKLEFRSPVNLACRIRNPGL